MHCIVVGRLVTGFHLQNMILKAPFEKFLSILEVHYPVPIILVLSVEVDAEAVNAELGCSRRAL